MKYFIKISNNCPELKLIIYLASFLKCLLEKLPPLIIFYSVTNSCTPKRQ